MNDQQKVKIQLFINDPIMSNAVYQALLNQFIKPKSGILTEEKAARFISIENLQDAWKFLEGFKSNQSQEPNQLKQVGL